MGEIRKEIPFTELQKIPLLGAMLETQKLQSWGFDITKEIQIWDDVATEMRVFRQITDEGEI